MPQLHERFRNELPRLTADNYNETSPASWAYNCIAWAAGATDKWWWPAHGRYWPPDAPLEETITAFLAVFAKLNYSSVSTADFEVGVEKIVLYAVAERPTHAARQLSNGIWTSKLGPSIDIEHATPDDVAGGTYGEVVAVLGRKTAT
jgi:hypothetical protein